MKLLLTILSVFMLLGLQTNALAGKEGKGRGCGKDTRVLTPGKHSVLLFDEPFVVQWQDDDKCLGDMVTIEIIELSTNERNVLGGLAPNIGNYSMDRLSHRIHRGNPGKRRIQISNAYDDRKKIKSKNFFIKTNRLESAYSEQELYYDKREDVGIRDILRRLTAIERQIKKDRNPINDLVQELEDQQVIEPICPSGNQVDIDNAECDEEEVCFLDGVGIIVPVVYGIGDIDIEWGDTVLTQADYAGMFLCRKDPKSAFCDSSFFREIYEMVKEQAPCRFQEG